MATTELHHLMAAIRTRLADIPDLGGRVYYPATNGFSHSPAVVIRQSVDAETRYHKEMRDRHRVLGMIDVMILVETTEAFDKPRDEAKIDSLIPQVLDALDSSLVLTGLAGKVDRIWDDAPVRRGSLRYGQQSCYAAIITLNSKFYRTPQPMEVSP